MYLKTQMSDQLSRIANIHASHHFFRKTYSGIQPFYVCIHILGHKCKIYICLRHYCSGCVIPNHFLSKGMLTAWVCQSSTFMYYFLDFSSYTLCKWNYVFENIGALCHLSLQKGTDIVPLLQRNILGQKFNRHLLAQRCDIMPLLLWMRSTPIHFLSRAMPTTCGRTSKRLHLASRWMLDWKRSRTDVSLHKLISRWRMLKMLCCRISGSPEISFCGHVGKFWHARKGTHLLAYMSHKVSKCSPVISASIRSCRRPTIADRDSFWICNIHLISFQDCNRTLHFVAFQSHIPPNFFYNLLPSFRVGVVDACTLIKKVCHFWKYTWFFFNCFSFFKHVRVTRVTRTWNDMSSARVSTRPES